MQQEQFTRSNDVLAARAAVVSAMQHVMNRLQHHVVSVLVT
jgi:hypothetical protein